MPMAQNNHQIIVNELHILAISSDFKWKHLFCSVSKTLKHIVNIVIYGFFKIIVLFQILWHG